MSRAVEKLAIAVQPVSTKVRELACALRCTWLKPAGYGLLPTDTKVTAMPDSLENLAQRLLNPCGEGR